MTPGSFSFDRSMEHGDFRRRPKGRAGRARAAAAVSMLPLIALGFAAFDGAVLFAAGQIARLLGAGH